LPHAIYEARNLGDAVSHGCVRLSVKNAATLSGLVKREKMANTNVVLTGGMPDAGPQTVAGPRPLPLDPDDPLYRAPPPLYQRVYGIGNPCRPHSSFSGARQRSYGAYLLHFLAIRWAIWHSATTPLSAVF
jgi:hypothetical protein